MAALVLRRLWPLTLLVACGAPAATAPPAHRPPPTPRVQDAGAPEPPPVAGFEERVADAEQSLTEVIEARDLAGPDELHVVLDAGRCWRITVVADPSATVTWRDEHSHEVAAGEGAHVALGPVCPRWSGSFVLSVEAPRARLWLQASASSAAESPSTVPSTD